MPLRVGASLLLSLLAGCYSSTPRDAFDADLRIDGGGADAGPPRCVSGLDCDDGLFCTGIERCDPVSPEADARGCVSRPSSTPCRFDEVCRESTDRCETDCDVSPDADVDGAVRIECGGGDCDDTDPTRYPGGVELCDVGWHDEDCDLATFGFRDLDSDGEPDMRCCNTDGSGTSLCGSDCDDSRPSVRPGAPEACNSRDDDCDGAVDEGC